jgi:putative membrane protein
VTGPQSGDEPVSAAEPAAEPVTAAPSADHARDHLANERTFLAWLRTGIAIVVLGFAIGQLALALPKGDSTGISVLLGTAAIVAGVAMVLAGLGRYRQSSRRIDLGEFRPAGSLIVVVAVVAAIFGVVLAIFLVYLELGAT